MGGTGFEFVFGGCHVDESYLECRDQLSNEPKQTFEKQNKKNRHTLYIYLTDICIHCSPAAILH